MRELRSVTVGRAIVMLCIAVALAGCNSVGRGALPLVPGLAENRAPSTVPTEISSFGLPSHASAAQLGLWPHDGPAVPLCPQTTRPRQVRCFAWIRLDPHGACPSDMPCGYAPSDLQTAYDLTAASAANGVHQTVAIVDAFDDPNIEADLGVYRKWWGLPECTTSNGCFAKKQFTTKTSHHWGGEESLDVDMVSAICPFCHILLVEAKGPGQDDMTVAEKYATAHASYVSNSWGTGEGYKKDDSAFDVRGVMIAAATGDFGYSKTAQWPAILPTVIGVGGTTLEKISPRVETAWSGAVSGCSKIYPKPSFQEGLNTGCRKRAEADVSASAGNSAGVAIYDSFGYTSGWQVIAGTSEATPIITAVYALGGCATPCTNPAANATYLYAHASHLNNITSGSNGSCGVPLCTAAGGWSGPTGLGTPNGLDAFARPVVTLSAASLTFYATDAGAAKSINVSQDGFSGTFTAVNSCKHIATISPDGGDRAASTFKVTPTGFGSCSAIFTGGDGDLAKVLIAVLKPKPVTLSPKHMQLYGTGASNLYEVEVSQAGYNGEFHVGHSCTSSERDKSKTIASIALRGYNGGVGYFNVTPVAAGSCSVSFEGQGGVSATLDVSVVIPGPVVLTPPSLSFDRIGGDAETVAVSQSGYSGSFGYTVSCGSPEVADLVEVGPNGHIVIDVEPDANGTCTDTITGVGGRSATLSVTVNTAKPTPSPSSPPLVVADFGNAAVKHIAANCFASATCVTAVGGGFTSPSGVAIDGSGNIFVADSGSGKVSKLASGCASASCVTALGGGFLQPISIAVDSSDEVFVFDAGTGRITKMSSTCTSSACVGLAISGLGGLDGIAVDSSGDIYVANTGAGTVRLYPSGCGKSTCSQALGGGFSEPLGIAIDGTGNVFVGDMGTNVVSEIPASCTSAACVETLGGGFNDPKGTAVDGFGNVFVSDSNNDAVKEIPHGCLSAGCVVTLGGGFNSPFGVALSPVYAASPHVHRKPTKVPVMRG